MPTGIVRTTGVPDKVAVNRLAVPVPNVRVENSSTVMVKNSSLAADVGLVFVLLNVIVATKEVPVWGVTVTAVGVVRPPFPFPP